MALAEPDGGRPITLDNLSLAAPTEIVRLEAVRLEAAAVRAPRPAAWLAAFGRYAMSTTFLSLRLKAGGVDADRYLGDVVANADFRKFDDGLRMTLDCSSEFADALEARLAGASDYADYGTFRQAAAQLTCYTPSVRERGHVHFVDGAGGGYTMAANAMKARRAARAAEPAWRAKSTWISGRAPLRAPRRFARLAGMDASADSPPPENAAPRLTPMMAQYFEIKTAHPDCLLFYRMGDFYELFFADAEIASRALGIVLTKRGKHEGEDIRMCGVPIERADDYLHRLIALGHRVAVCEQLEDPAEAKKRGGKSVVKRDVVRLVTPGTITEERLLEPGRANVLLAVQRVRSGEGRAVFGLAALDISTGAFDLSEADEAGLEPRNRAPGAERDRRAAGLVRRSRLFPADRGDEGFRDAAGARFRRRRGGGAGGARVLRRRDAGGLRPVHPRRNRRRRCGAALRQAHADRRDAAARAADAARARRRPRNRRRDARQSRTHPHALRRARGLAVRHDRHDRDARRRAPPRRAAGEPAHRPP